MSEEVYREAQRPVDPLTDGELALWDRTYAAHSGTRWAEHYADDAVKLRREKFGVR